MPIPPNDEVKSALKKMMEEREKGINIELKECKYVYFDVLVLLVSNLSIPFFFSETKKTRGKEAQVTRRISSQSKSVRQAQEQTPSW